MEDKPKQSENYQERSLRVKLQEVCMLSPIEDRQKIEKFLGYWLFQATEPDLNERYLAMFVRTVTMTISLIVATVLGLYVTYTEFILGYEDNDYPAFSQALDGLGAVGFHAYYHAQIMGWVVITFVPLCFAVFMIHARLGEYNVFRKHPNPAYRELKSRKTLKFRLKMLFCSVVGIAIGYGGIFYSYMCLVSLKNLANISFSTMHDSIVTLVLFGVFAVAAHTVVAVMFFLGMILLWGMCSDLVMKKDGAE